MNIAILGSKNVKKLSDILYKSFEAINVVGYDNVARFREAMVSRPLEFHRMLLLEPAVSSEDITSDDIYDFQDMVLANYPAMKIITISTNPEYTKFLAGLFIGRNYGHFCFTSLKGKILVDLVSKDIPELQRHYATNVYREDMSGMKDEVVEAGVNQKKEAENKNEIEGYIAPPEETGRKKRSLGARIFGFGGPKEAGDLTMDSGLSHIGQGTGISDFSEGISGIDFSSEQPVSDDNNEVDVDMSGFEQEQSDFENNNFDFFGGLEGLDVGLGHFDNTQDDFANNDEPSMEEAEDPSPILYRKPVEEEEPKFDINRLEKEAYVPTLEVDDAAMHQVDEDEHPVNVPMVDLDSLKKTVENTDFVLSDAIFQQPNFVDKIDIEDADVSGFDGDMGALMSQYDDMNKPKEAPPQVIYVPQDGTSKFRNKNGVKIIIVTGDRRVGSTKLALNLANKYAIREKVLFVDFDRNRHGSLGYLDLDSILEEPEHVQNGFNHLKNLNILRNVCHYYKKGKFFTLTSMYGSYADNNQMRVVQDVLAAQKDYTSVVIDCPLEDLPLLQNIMPFAKILFCVEDDKVGVINFVSMINSLFENENILFSFFEKSYFVVGRKGNVDKFRHELANIIDLFDLDEGMCKWANIEVLGVVKDVNSLYERTGD